ncbi:mannosyltransferase family protein [Streptomyces sp. NBC_00448]|uniref:mannosyltransferase family protein n=1 Tax=Streptomyces sp. NBC_00448 TaxID=2903652 RepID=UPI002E1A509D
MTLFSAPPATEAAPAVPREPSGARRRRPSPVRRFAARLTPADRDVLWLYVLTRAGLWVTEYCARWIFPADADSRRPMSVLAPWQQWDWAYYLHIARDGYFPAGGPGPGEQGWDNRDAFFPGFPMVLRAVHTVIRDWTAAGLTVSFVAGAVAVLALGRIAGRDLPGADAGRSTVQLFLLSPCAVFLAAGYTEALFLALALPAWLAARRAAWGQAAVLTCLACAVRVSGLFLAAALAVQFLAAVRRPRDLRALPWLALPVLPPLLYSAYLKGRTGDWMAWKDAEERGWARDFHSPWTAWHHTWTAAFGHTQGTGYAAMFQAELLAMLAGVAVLVYLLWRHRWAEAVYIALSLWALGTSYWYMSIPRAALLWWPLWTSLCAATTVRPRLRTAYFAVAGPLATVVALAFFTGRWAG